MEKKVTVVAKGEEWVNVPDALIGIEYGDLLVISKFPDTHKYTAEQRWLKDIRIVADEYVRYCMAENIPLTIYIDGEVPATHRRILEENGYNGKFDNKNPVELELYIDQLTFYDKVPGVKEPTKLKTYSIHHERHDRKIIDEMIAKVDVDRFKKLCAIALGHGKKPGDDVVKKILEDWAEAKYDYYVTFGNQLVISGPIDFQIDETEMAPMIYGLYQKYPMYAATLDKIVEDGTMAAFTKNEMPKSKFFAKYAPDDYKAGMKISKFLSHLFSVPRGVGKDGSVESLSLSERFDIDFSKAMQDRVIKGKVCISIDPYDFLTSGTNMHGWSTCQKIWGSMAGGVFTWLTDPNALVAYRENGKEYLYDKIMSRGVEGREEFDFGKNAFRGNSKSWRQIINGDVNTCTFLFGREYPQNKEITEISDKARELLEAVVGKAIGVTDWDNYGDLDNIHNQNYFGGGPVYKDVTNHHYSDIRNWHSLRQQYKIKKALVAPSGSDMSKAHVTAGGHTYCLICGKKLRSDNSGVTCGEH